MNQINILMLVKQESGLESHEKSTNTLRVFFITHHLGAFDLADALLRDKNLVGVAIAKKDSTLSSREYGSSTDIVPALLMN